MKSELLRLAAALPIAAGSSPAVAAYSDLVGLSAAVGAGEPIVFALLALGLVVVAVVLLPLAWWPPSSVKLSRARGPSAAPAVNQMNGQGALH